MAGRSPEELRASPKNGRCYLCGRELPRPEPEPEYPVMRRFSTPEDRLRQHIAPVVTR